MCEIYLVFLYGQLRIFQSSIKKIEGSKKSVIEVIAILEQTAKIINEQYKGKFIPLSVKSLLSVD